jgi:hypothetical protein
VSVDITSAAAAHPHGPAGGTPSARASGRTAALLALLVVALLAVLTACSSGAPSELTRAAQTAFYVDCSRALAGDGTAARPWRSLEDVAAHGAFDPGDSLLLRRGTVCTGRLAPTGSGTNGDPIVLGAFGSGPRPVVQGGGTPIGTGAVQLTDQHDWVIEDLMVTNRPAAGTDGTARSGILVVDDRGGRLSRITIRRNDVRDVTGDPGAYRSGGIVVLARSSAPENVFSNVLVEDNTVVDVGRVGVAVWSDTYPAAYSSVVTVRRNVVTRAEGDSILLYGVRDGVIDHNVSRDGGHLPPCPSCASPVRPEVAGIWPTRSEDVVMRYNEVSGENAAGGDGEGFDIDLATSGIVMEGNAARGNGGGGVLVCGTSGAIIRRNVFQANGGGEITFSCDAPLSHVYIVGNTIAVAPGTAVVRRVAGSGTDPLVFSDNVVINPGGGGFAWPSPVTSEGNTILGPGATAPSLVVAPYSMSEGIDSASGYRPAPGSNLTGTGASVPQAGALDYFGATTAATDRGAIAESGPPPVPPTPSAPRVVRTGAATVSVDWTPPDGYLVGLERSRGGGRWVPVVEATNAASYEDVGVPGGDWSYRVRAIGRDAVSAPSAPSGRLSVPLPG